MRLSALLLLLVLWTCATAGPSHNDPKILERLRDSDDRLRVSLAELDVVPFYAPYDISAYDGTMEGHEIEAIRRVTANIANGPASIRYGVYNLKNDRITEALIEAFKAGVKVQVFVDASKLASSRYKEDDKFKAAGLLNIFKERKDAPVGFDWEGSSWFAGVKTSSLYHNKMRLFTWHTKEDVFERRFFMTGSLNAGEESMSNDESIIKIENDRLFDKYLAFYRATYLRQEKKFVNQWDESEKYNVMFSPNADGYVVGRKILDWIDQENEFIFLTVFSLNPFDDKVSGRDLYTSLKQAHDRGAFLLIVTDRKQSDGPSGYGDPFDDMLRAIGKDTGRVVVYEVINDVGMFNAMHLKDAIFGITDRSRLVTDTANWSSAAFGSCKTIVKGVIAPKKSCSPAASAESTLFIDEKRVALYALRHHLTLLDRYWRQIPVQKTGDPSPEETFARIAKHVGEDKMPFQRTTILVHKPTQAGEFIELRGEKCADASCASTVGASFSYANSLNADNVNLKNSFRFLSWTRGMTLDWTTNDAGYFKRYENDGFGYSAESPSANQWKFLAYIDGRKGEWMQVKAAMTNGAAGPVTQWETDVPASASLNISPGDSAAHRRELPPVKSTNHWARLGYVTQFDFYTGGGGAARNAAAGAFGVAAPRELTSEATTGIIVAAVVGSVLVVVAIIGIAMVVKHRRQVQKAEDMTRDRRRTELAEQLL